MSNHIDRSFWVFPCITWCARSRLVNSWVKILTQYVFFWSRFNNDCNSKYQQIELIVLTHKVNHFVSDQGINNFLWFLILYVIQYLVTFLGGRIFSIAYFAASTKKVDSLELHCLLWKLTLCVNDFLDVWQLTVVYSTCYHFDCLTLLVEHFLDVDLNFPFQRTSLQLLVRKC